jgi:hypothetical protein
LHEVIAKSVADFEDIIIHSDELPVGTVNGRLLRQAELLEIASALLRLALHLAVWEAGLAKKLAFLGFAFVNGGGTLRSIIDFLRHI